jgi:type II secretory pathway pseudopilin PulG
MVNINDNRGITLIELVIVALVMGIIMIGIHNIFSSQDQAARTTSLITEMNQNLRIAEYWLTRDIRVAGYRLEGGTTSSGIGTLSAITITDSNPDQIDILYAQSDASCTVTDSMPSASAEIKVDSITGLGVDDLIIITDGTHTSLFQITGIQDAGVDRWMVQHAPGNPPGGSPYNNPGGHTDFPPGGYPAGSRLYRVVYHTYRIGTQNGIPRLEVNFHRDGGQFVPLAEYIEDLQITPTVNNSPTYTITITARTSLQERGLPGDGYRRKSLTWTVRMRNIP